MNEERQREDRLERYLAGALSEDERRRFEEEILRSPELAADVYDELAAREAFEDATRLRAAVHATPHGAAPSKESGLAVGLVEGRERARLAPAGRPWRLALRWALPPVAAAVLLVAATVVWRLNEPEAPTAFRGEPASLSAVAPRDEVDTVPTRFVWHRDPAASRVRFELFDAESRLLFSTITADSFLTLPPATTAPARGYWKVTALDESNLAGPSTGPVWYRVGPR
jgi:hypothetical protein